MHNNNAFEHSRSFNSKLKQISSVFKYIFVNGPTWLGSWEGQSISDICSGLTRVNALHWDLDTKACEDLVDRKVHSSLIGASVVFAGIMAYTSVQACMNAFFFAFIPK